MAHHMAPLVIHPDMLNAWDYKRKHENRPLPKRLEVKIEFLNFGDGTGLSAVMGQPFRAQYRRKDV